MELLICSDSHGDNDSLKELIKRYPNCDYYLHLGDSESDEYTIYPFISVKGNCDFYNFSEQLIIDTPKGKLLAKHYPTIPFDIIKEYGIKFFIHGHTHMRRNEKRENLLILNPGSIAYSRDASNKSFLILNITNDKIDIDFEELN